MPASLWLELLKGGPFDGLPALSLRFEKSEEELDLGETLKVLLGMSPPPMHLRILFVEGGDESEEGILRLLAQANALGMATSVEIFGAWERWMTQVGWRCLHTIDECVPHPVEEIVFHGNVPPHFSFFPFHAAKPPLLWWDPSEMPDDIFSLIPQNVRLWLPRRVPQRCLFPQEEP